MRETWTDERLGDLKTSMDAGFARVDADIRALSQGTNARFDALQRTMLQVGGGVIAALLGVIATQL